jgi:hypothetical protein
MILHCGIAKFGTYNALERKIVAENVVSVSAEWLLNLFLIKLKGTKTELKVKDPESAWMLLLKVS